jgi:arginyl-tRNA synthetase
MKDTIKQNIDSILAGLDLSAVDYTIEHPADMAHGDWAVNVAMVLAKKVGKVPRALAEEIVSKLKEKNVPGIREITIAGPGFINITLDNDVFRAAVLNSIVPEISENISEKKFAGKKILVEHSSPNLFKPFHIGHLMNNTIGESIVRLARESGAEVTTMSYPSDVSLGIAKALWAVLTDGIDKINSLPSENEKLAYMGECYSRGTKSFEESEEVQVKVKEITQQLFDKIPGDVVTAYEICKKINLDYFVSTTGRLGSHFDSYVFESESGVEGEKIVRANIPNVFTESNGAVIYEGEKDGLHTRVFINKENRPTYEAKDVGLLSLKFSRYNPDLSIFVTDHEQQPYFEVVSTAAGKINPEWKAKTVHRTHGRMTFKGAKMSSRNGGVPLATDIINDVAIEVRLKEPELSNDDIDAIAIGAVKFTILRAQAGKNIDFDPDRSLSFEGDSGPYLQYTVVRALSVLSKAGNSAQPDLATIKDVPATRLEKLLSRFDEVVLESVDTWSPHHVCTYLLELAQAFNSWYGNTRIIDAENPAMPYNLALVKASANTITKGLDLLGMKVPSKM